MRRSSTDNALPRVCVASDFPPPPGGLGLQAKLLVERLRGEGCPVRVVDRRIRDGRLAGWVNRVWGLRAAVRCLTYTGRLILALPAVEVVHIFSNSFLDFGLYTVPAVLLGRLGGKRVVVHYHGGAAQRFLARDGWMAKPMLALAHRVVVPSGFLQRVFQEHGMPVTVIPNICNLEAFRFKSRAPLSPKLIVARHLEKQYNVGCAIRAFSLVKAQYPAARLTVLGSGAEESRLRRLSDQLGLNGSVDFLGAVDHAELDALYWESDICVNPSNVDNMPVSVMEAFACGLPVVCTNAGGNPYLVIDGETGLLVERDDHARMGARICELLRDARLARRVADQARAAVTAFSWESIKSQWFEVYQP